MNQKFILAFILLFTLSVTNATQFYLCRPEEPLPVPNVTIDPDPLTVNTDTVFHVSGTLGSNLYGVSIILEDANTQQIDYASYDFFDNPFKAGSPFNFGLNYKIEKNLPSSYTIAVYFFDSEAAEI
ncbi:21833_t:CDS:1, partial [Gigaspora margarita]